MRQPSILLLLALNVMAAFSSYLALKLGIAAWTADGWSTTEIGVAVTLVGFSYAALVSFGGKLADRFGRARVSSCGVLLGAVGCALPLCVQTPLVAAAAAMLSFAGCAFFFPGIAGLFSDSEASHATAKPLSLHLRISQYNIGWSSGNVLGFVTAFLIGSWSNWVGYTLCTVLFVVPFLILLRYIQLPPAQPASVGDRATHPDLERLILNGRIGLLIACLVGFSLCAELDKALSEHLAPSEASRRASFALASYSGGYCLMFILLGQWAGWVLHPRRLLWLQAGLLIGPVGLISLGCAGVITVPWLTLFAFITGLGYGAFYNASIYYSLRLPHGASRAAGLHETFLGVGITAGPVLCGVLMLPLRQVSHLAALGIVAAGFAAINLVYQLVMLPKAHPA